MFGIHTRRGKENSNQHFVSPGLSTVFLGRHRVVVYSIYFFKSSFLNCHVFQLSPPRVGRNVAGRSAIYRKIGCQTRKIEKSEEKNER